MRTAVAVFVCGWLCALPLRAQVVGQGAGPPADDSSTGPEQEATAARGSSAPPVAGSSDDHPDEHRLRYFDDVQVTERSDNLLGVAASANEGSTGAGDLARRPIQRAGELVETVPGAIATQHSGGGKANQYFLRGFNLDHGTDFALSVGGMPVNMPSHGHGQGYADANFLIPELVERAQYRKGPYRAAVGDFSAAGSVDFDLVSSLPKGVASVTLGSFDHRRALLADSLRLGGGSLTAALEYFHDDGPWRRPDQYRRWNGLLGYAAGDTLRGWSLRAMGSDGDWLATDQVPRRAVASGLLDAYGIVDEGPRGSTSRYSLSAESHRGSTTSFTRGGAYAIRYDFRLFSNFTYFLEDPELGDEFEQQDDRWVLGGAAGHTFQHHLGRVHAETSFGGQLRYDTIANGLFRTSDLARTSTVREDEIRQLGAGLWGDTWLRPGARWRINAGLRADLYRADVRALSAPPNSGGANDWILSPKLSVVYRPLAWAELTVNAGSGFHSNDARGATIRVDPVSGEPVQRVNPLVRARGVDLGVRTFTGGGYHGTLTGFWLKLDSELLFVGDGGTTEASRPSRRVGVEWTNTWRVTRQVDFDLDLTFTRARFTDDHAAGSRIPGAIGTTLAAGLGIDEVGRWSGGLRLRFLSGGPLLEDGSVSWGETALLSGRVAFDVTGRLQVVVDGFNLLDRRDDDIAYFYRSRLAGEPRDGVEDVHFHPVARRSARASLVWRF